MRARWLGLAALLLVAGCGTTERSGGVGDKLSDGSLQATLLKTGTPKDDKEAFGVKVEVCNDAG